LRNAETGRLFAGGCALGAALLTRHELGVVALPVFALLVAESRPPGRRTVSNVVTVAIPLAAAMAIWLAYNFARFGDPLDSGQVIAGQPSIDMLRSPSTTFGRSMTESLAGLLFSPSTSVFLYSPIVIIGILSFALMARRELSTTVVVAVQVLGYLLLVAAAGNWSAGRAYGSRYLVTVVPLVCLPLAYWFRDAGMLARRSGFVVLAASVLVQLPGVLVDYSRVEQAYAYAHAPQPVQERLWSWPAADLVLNARAAARQLPLNVRLLRGAEPRPTVGPTGMTRRASLTEQLAFSLDFWWLYLFHLGVLPARVAVLGLFIPLAVAGVCAWRVARLVHHAERAGP
jgi:hypothetical protein